MEIKGKIKVINETKTFGASGFKKRELVVTTNDQYPQPLLIEFVQDKCDLLNNFNINDEVTIAVNLRGKEWVSPEGETKYFNSINGWKIVNKNSDGINTPPPLEENNNNSFLTDESDNENPFPF